jgi:hypothetical protein
MTVSMVLPELTGGLGDALVRALDSGRTGGWTPEGGEATAESIQLTRQFVARIKANADSLLRGGVDARDFVRHFEQVVHILDRCLAHYARLEEQGALTTAPAGVASEFGGVRREMTACRDLLAGVLATANAPPGEVDWAKVKRARDAYARGETRTVQAVVQGANANGNP